MARILILFGALLLAASQSEVVRADDLLWPLPESRILTGGFADSRNDHFHGGVDLRTFGRALPVVAPADGWVERIAVSPSGYGRVLYFRLSDGRTAVFGHLSRFEPRIESMMRDSQLVRGTYRMDCLYADSTMSCVFRKGDLLAYTGSSGVGAPHLHFEIRNEAVQTDPLRNFSPLDKTDPLITGVSWISLSDITPTARGKRVTLTREAGSRWQGSAIRSDEAVALFIQTYDPGPWGRHAVPSVIRVLIGDRIAHEIHCARIDLLGPAEIYARIVWSARRHNDTDIRRLFDMPTANADSMDVSRGWLHDLNGEPVTVQVVDRAGNTAEVFLNVTAGAWNPLKSPSSGGTLCSGRFEVELGHDPLAAWAEIESLGDREIRIGPDDFAFGDRHVLTYRLADGESLPGLYFYERRESGGRRTLWRRADRDATESIACNVLRGGVYGVAEDHDPPRLLVSGGQGKLTFELTDSESGVDDSSIRCAVDGRAAIPEFEYDERGGPIWTDQPLGKGPHDVVFWAADRAGNERSWNVTVTVR
ncbi:M23 family metallopeptidase [bacterium]|nr:M23 family metallopeptidase [bacterium]MBU1983683.1 M23 family metallopeptidase [bacterium]